MQQTQGAPATEITNTHIEHAFCTVCYPHPEYGTVIALCGADVTGEPVFREAEIDPAQVCVVCTDYAHAQRRCPNGHLRRRKA
jgi:hypothetical protein